MYHLVGKILFAASAEIYYLETLNHPLPVSSVGTLHHVQNKIFRFLHLAHNVINTAGNFTFYGCKNRE